jgi:hypothetical protein
VLKGCDIKNEPCHAHESAVNVRKLLFVVIQQTAGHAPKNGRVQEVNNPHAIYFTLLLHTAHLAIITGLNRGQTVTHYIKPRWFGA